jgi:hypothetical protein
VDQRDYEYRKMRDIWSDFNQRQEFEHDLINRKASWLLTGETILFAAYGVSFRAQEGTEGFRGAVAWSGLLIAAFTLLGVATLIISKVVSWWDYRGFYKEERTPNPPQPLD